MDPARSQPNDPPRTAVIQLYDEDSPTITALKIARRKAEQARLECVCAGLAIGTIIEVVAKFYDTTPAALASRSRRKKAIVPRQIAMYLCRRYTHQPTSVIARAFARSHPSVSNAEQVVERRVLKGVPFRNMVEAISAWLDQLERATAPASSAQRCRSPIRENAT